MLSLVAASGGYSSLRCTGFSLRWFLLLQSTGSSLAGFSSYGTRALERRLSSCGARTSLLRGMWELPNPGLEPMSPALAGGFLTTAPPGKPNSWLSLFSPCSESVFGLLGIGDRKVVRNFSWIPKFLPPPVTQHALQFGGIASCRQPVMSLISGPILQTK